MRLPGRFGSYGGFYVPEILVPVLEQLESAWLEATQDAAFRSELDSLLQHYAGRPTPLYCCRNLVPEPGRIYLKREDLLHGGAHKTNQALAQGLLAKRMGKNLLIAETGAGQHGVATALAGAVLGIPVRIYMGASDIHRQRANVLRMQLMGAEVVEVRAGSGTLKEAINEALRAWSGEYERAHYLLGTAAGPHPFPSMVRDFQRVIGDEARAQFLSAEGALPDVVIACVGGGSNALGIFTAFLGDEEVRLIGVEAGGTGMGAGQNGATLARGRLGSLHGAWTMVLQDDEGQIDDSHSIAAGLDYPGVGPEHVHLMKSGRATYTTCGDRQALNAFQALARAEGILPALESAHAVAEALRQTPRARRILVNLSGRGDKDLDIVAGLLGGKESAT